MDLSFIDSAPKGSQAVIHMLATAESLTDLAFEKIYKLAPVENIPSAIFLMALRQTTIVESRNSEWSFRPKVREALLRRGGADTKQIQEAHRVLLSLGQTGDHALAGSHIPSYLFLAAGQAYHLASLGERDRAMDKYGDVAANGTASEFWLASNLIEEQIKAGLLPEDRSELLFVRASALRRDGKISAAISLFRKLADLDEQDVYVERACDYLGVQYRQSDRPAAIRYLNKAILIANHRNDHDFKAIHLHNLAQALPNNERSEKIRYCWEAIEISEQKSSGVTAAFAKNTLGDLLTHEHDPKSRALGEKLLRDAITFFKNDNDDFHARFVQTTLARNLSRQKGREKEAENLFKESMRIAELYNDRRGVSLAAYGLGKLLSTILGREKDAIAMLEKSIGASRTEGEASIARRLLSNLRK